MKLFLDDNGKKINQGFVEFIRPYFFEDEELKKKSLHIKKKNGRKLFTLISKKIVGKYPKKSGLISSFQRKNVTFYPKINNSTRDSLGQILDYGTLYFQNLNKNVTKEELVRLLSPFGYILRLETVKSNNNIANSKCAYVKFLLPDCAIKAASYLDGKIFKTSIFNIKTVKENRKIPFLKEHSTLNWFLRYKNIFSNHNHTICYENMISRFKGTFYKDLLEKNYGRPLDSKAAKKFQQDSKVQSVLSESRLLSEIKLFLEKQGFSISRFNFFNLPKSLKTSMSIKNFPISGKLFIQKFFLRFGEILNMNIFSNLSIIIVEFKRNQNAELAFEKLKQIKKIHEQLEFFWILGSKNKKLQKNSKVQINSDPNSCLVPFGKLCKKNIINNSSKLDGFRGLSFKEGENQLIYEKKNYFQYDKNQKFCKVVLKNLPFSVQVHELKKALKNSGKILSIRIPKRNYLQSTGFAFITYPNLEEAKSAIWGINSVKIQGRNIIAKINNSKL
mmetsp:Transcript_20802/g.32595  ORF Transcript_20802/g.32595 Transcript_20802/m.32595 type:complete len:502 (-) Transcript_20802:2501-4006(-)